MPEGEKQVFFYEIFCLFSFLKRRSTQKDKIPARTEVPAKFSQIPVRASGHRRMTRRTGKISAVETEIKEAYTGFFTASIKL